LLRAAHLLLTAQINMKATSVW